MRHQLPPPSIEHQLATIQQRLGQLRLAAERLETRNAHLLAPARKAMAKILTADAEAMKAWLSAGPNIHSARAPIAPRGTVKI
jgi:hypothetical protein